MSKNHLTEAHSAPHHARAIIPGLVWFALLFVSYKLTNDLLGKRQFLLASCVTCIGFGGTPLLGRWLLLRVYERLSRRDRFWLRVFEVVTLIGMVVAFSLCYIISRKVSG